MKGQTMVLILSGDKDAWLNNFMTTWIWDALTDFIHLLLVQTLIGATNKII